MSEKLICPVVQFKINAEKSARENSAGAGTRFEGGKPGQVRPG